MEAEKMKVAVIILNWNGENLLRKFLPSVIRNTNAEIGQVIVVDNHSTDSSMACLEKEFPEVERLVLDKNYGFAGGYNRAIKQIEAEYAVLLNSDVETTAGWLEPLVDVLDKEEKVAAVQPKIKSYHEKNKFEYAGACGGYIDYLGFPFCRGRIMDEIEIDHGQYEDIRDVFWVTGAALCIRRNAYLEAGGLDETFFAHMEEIDLCWRLKNIGYILKVIPASVVYHLGGGSLPMNHPRKLFLNYRNNLLMLYKNLGSEYRTRVFFVRFWLDGMAALLFLLKGKISNTRSIIRAYRAFYKLKSSYPPGEGSDRLDGIYHRSIIREFFLNKKRKFSELKLE